FRNRRRGVDEHEWREGRVMTAQVPMVPSRENLRVSAGGGAGNPAGVHVRHDERFYTRHQPPAGHEGFHHPGARVERVVTAEGGAGNIRTDFHAGPGQVERRDLGGNVKARTDIAEVPRTDRSADGNVKAKTDIAEVPRIDRSGNSGNAGARED